MATKKIKKIKQLSSVIKLETETITNPIIELIADLQDEIEYAQKINDVFLLIDDTIVGRELNDFMNNRICPEFSQKHADNISEHFEGLKTGLEIAVENLKDCLRKIQKREDEEEAKNYDG